MTLSPCFPYPHPETYVVYHSTSDPSDAMERLSAYGIQFAKIFIDCRSRRSLLIFSIQATAPPIMHITPCSVILINANISTRWQASTNSPFTLLNVIHLVRNLYRHMDLLNRLSLSPLSFCLIGINMLPPYQFLFPVKTKVDIPHDSLYSVTTLSLVEVCLDVHISPPLVSCSLFTLFETRNRHSQPLDWKRRRHLTSVVKEIKEKHPRPLRVTPLTIKTPTLLTKGEQHTIRRISKEFSRQFDEKMLLRRATSALSSLLNGNVSAKGEMGPDCRGAGKKGRVT